MPDKVSLVIGDKVIKNFISYQVESDLFVAGDAFKFDVINPDIEITEGARCELMVNDQLELNGVIDRISDGYSKAGKKLTIEGRDLMGLLVDSYCEEYPTLENITLKALAEKLIKNVPFINTKSIIYGKGDKDRAVPLSAKEEDYEFAQIEPGQTIFEVLRNYALSRGMLFFSLPDGTFIFGEPVTSGAPDYVLICKKDGTGNNIITSERVRDISKRFSTVTIVGQRQGSDDWDVDDINFEGTAEDKSFPFKKPFVATLEFDGQNPEKYANILIDKQKFDGFELSYKTRGHSQNGKNFQVNTVCHVIDEIFGFDDDFLVYGRVFEMSKRDGVTTTLKLSKLGVLPA
jgi:prophage tail gpP-like protein